MNLNILHDNVHLWLISFKKLVSELNYFYSTLSSEEIQRANKFYFAKDRSSFIITRGALRTLLSKYLAIKTVDISFQYNKYGKPAILMPDSKVIEFNISHSCNFGLIAISKSNPLGVDIEEIKNILGLTDIAKQYFSDSEYRQLAKLPKFEKLRCFFNIWTRKEAYIKGEGKGLTIPLNSFNVSTDKLVQPTLLETDSNEGVINHWSIYNINTPENYVGALAIKSQNCQVQYFEFSQNI